MNSFKTFITSSLLALTLSACANTTNLADTVFINGKIYTVDKTLPWVDALAIKDGKIIARGDNRSIKPYIGVKTQTIDLQGKMAMPGINDAHSHLYGGLKEKYYCLFPASSTPDEIRAKIGECTAKTELGGFVIGGYWASNFFDKNDIASPRKWLDAISTDIAIILSDDSGHNNWLNSKALEELGYDNDAPDPEGGTIVRGQDNIPNGLLYESAAVDSDSFYEKRWTKQQRKTGLRHAFKLMTRYGITGIKDAATRPEDLEIMYEIDTREGLTAFIASSQWTTYGKRETPLDYDYFSAQAKKYSSENLNANFIKFFLDGVPTSSRSAAMTMAYAPDANHHSDTANKGMLHVQGDTLKNDVAELDKRGFTIKIHAAGDRSVQEAMRAYAHARTINSNQKLMHEIAHAGFITDADMGQFAALNIAVDISPYLWFPSPILDNIKSVLPERSAFYWPNKTLLEMGATIIAGSDWPSVSPSISPWPGIEATVTRKNPTGDVPGVYWPEERLTLEQTLEIFTRNGAKALLLDQEIGSLEVGKYANVIVLNHNLFTISPDDISETIVEQTWFKGKDVSQKVAE